MTLTKMAHNIKDSLGDDKYNLIRKIYRKTIKRPLIYFLLRYRLLRYCDVEDISYILSKRPYIPHPYGIVISIQTKIGFNCKIFQNVTLAMAKEGVPTLKNNVTIYPNSVIIGGVTIGENSIVGAGSIVTKNIPKNQIWAGNPAKKIKTIKGRK